MVGQLYDVKKNNYSNLRYVRSESYCMYTVSQKSKPLMFDNNFGKFWPIFKTLSPGYSQENSHVYTTQISTSPAICWYTMVACNFWKFKKF